MQTKIVDNFCTVTSKKADGLLSAVASTGTLDRDGEIVAPSAFLLHLDRYRKNPVILAAHTHRSADGRPTIIGSADRVEVKDGALEFDMRFSGTAVGQEWKKLFDEGHARAFSIGFIPKAGAFDKARGAYVWTEVELLEISAVAVPANPEALARRGVDGSDTGKPTEAAPKPADLAREIETIGAQFAKTEQDRENFGTIAQAVRTGEVSQDDAARLLTKMHREIQRRSEGAERSVTEAIDKLLKSAGSKAGKMGREVRKPETRSGDGW